jgi:ribonuclease P protein component
VRDRDAHSVIVERLKRRNDFRAAAKGLRASGRTFVLQALPRAETGAARVGFTVTRQVGNSVERNRVRRRLREMVRVSTAAGVAHLRHGHDYVLIGRRAALATPFGDMVQELNIALARVHGSGNKGTGSDRRDPLHEAGPQQSRRSRMPPA